MNSYENESLAYECDLTAERDRLREVNKELLEVLDAFRTWHANHFEDFRSDINAELLCLANDASAAIAKAQD